MITSEERPSVAERYASAIESSNLRVAETRCDTDFLMAAGWSADDLGASLFRLRSEFDGAKSECRGQGATALVDQVLMLSKLKSLPSTKAMLGRFAVTLATRIHFMQPDSAVAVLTGRALQAYLDPTCPHCEGRGKNGGYGEPEVICRSCRGSGQKAVNIGRDDEERRFVATLLAEMDRKASSAEQSMARMLRSTSV